MRLETFLSPALTGARTLVNVDVDGVKLRVGGVSCASTADTSRAAATFAAEPDVVFLIRASDDATFGLVIDAVRAVRVGAGDRASVAVGSTPLGRPIADWSRCPYPDGAVESRVTDAVVHLLVSSDASGRVSVVHVAYAEADGSHEDAYGFGGAAAFCAAHQTIAPEARDAPYRVAFTADSRDDVAARPRGRTPTKVKRSPQDGR